MIRKVFKNKIGKLVALSMSMALVLAMTGCNNKEIVAKVDSVDITKDELYDVLVHEYGDQVLNGLIAEKIVQLEIEKQGIEIAEEEIQKDIDKLMEYYGGEDRFNEALKYQGFTIEDMKENIKANLQVKKLLEPKISVSEEEIKEFFEQNKDAMAQEEQVSARHILVETEEEAKKIRQEIVDGGDFAELAKEHSLDESSKIMGGSLGFFGRGKMLESFDDVAFSLEKGEISQPVKSKFGYHIIQVEDKKEAKTANLEESRDDIERILFENKLPQAYSEWYEEKVGEYEITNNLGDKLNKK